MRSSKIRFTFLAAVLLLAIDNAASAQTWSQTAAGTFSWNVNANPPWSTSTFPNAVDATANVDIDILGNQTINLNQLITVGSLYIGDTNGAQTTTLNPVGGSLSFDVTAGNAVLTRASGGTGAVTISAPIAINDPTVVTNNALGGVFTLSGTITGTGNISLNNNSATVNGITVSGSLNHTGTLSNLSTGTGQTWISSVIGTNVTGVIQNSETSLLALTNNNTFTSGVTINSGTAWGSNAGAFGVGGAITLNPTGIADAILQGNLNGTFANPINVTNAGAGSGRAVITSTVNTPTFSGAVTLNNKDLWVAPVANNIVLSGGMSGTGNLMISNSGAGTTIFNTNPVNMTGAITNAGSGTATTTISSVIGSNVTGVIQNSTTSQLTLSGNNSAFAGGLTVKNGLVVANTNANVLGTGIITLGDTGGSSEARLFVGVAGTYANAINVVSGSSGLALLDSSVNSTFSGPITLNKDLRIRPTANSITVNVSGGVTGNGDLTFAALGNGGTIVHTNQVNNNGTIINAATSTGALTINSSVGSNVTGITQNSAGSSALIVNGVLNVNSGGTTLTKTNAAGGSALVVNGGVAGTGNLVLNNDSVTANGIQINTGSLNNTGTVTNSGSGLGSSLINSVIGSNVTGVIQNSATSALTLNGNNSTFAGGVTIKSGTLAGGNANAFGTAPITLGDTSGAASATLQGNVNGVVANAINVISGSSGLATITSGHSSQNFSGAVTLSKDLLIAPAGANVTLSGGITGSGNLTVATTAGGGATISNSVNNVGAVDNAGSGTGTTHISAVIGPNVTSLTQNSATSQLWLSGTNTYTGPTTINAGALRLGANTATGSLSPSSTITNNGSLEFWRTNTVTQGVDFASGISGTGSITKFNNNLLILNGANTYSGGTNLQAGTIEFDTNSLGTSGNIAFIGNSTLRWAAGNTQDVSSRLDIGALIATLDTNGNNLNFAGVIGGTTGSLTKTGAGTLTLNAPQTYSGVTSVLAGTLVYGVNNNLGTGGLTVNGSLATLDMGSFNDTVGQVILGTTGSIIGTGTLTSNIEFHVNSNSATSISAALAGSAPLNKFGTGVLTINNAANAYSGGTNIQNGTINFVSGALGTTGNITFIGNSTLLWNGHSDDLSNRLSVDRFIGTVNTNGNNVNFANAVGGTSGGLTKSGTGTLTLNGVQAYTGVTTVNGGVLQFNNALAAQNSTVAVSIANGLTFGTGIGTFTVGGLAGNQPFSLQDTGATAVTLEVGNNHSGQTYSGVMSGSGGITKIGMGTQILSGANSYTGATTVNEGLLLINGNQPLATGAITVNAGGQLGATANGTVGGAVTVAGGADIRMSTNNANNTFTLNSTLDFAGTSGSPNKLFFDAITNNTDTIAVSGAVTSPGAGGGIVHINANTTLAANTYNLITAASGITPGNFSLATTRAFNKAFSLTGVGDTALQLNVAAGTAGVATSWNGGTGTDWTTGANWSSGSPGYSSVVTYNTPSNTTMTLGDDFEISSLTYGVSATNSTSLGGTNWLSLGAAAGITVNTPSSGTPVHTISANIGIQQNQTWTVNTGGALNVSGVIDDYGVGRTLAKAGAGTLTLSGVNTHSGLTTVSAGTLAYGINDAIATGGITIGNATLDMAGFSDTVGQVSMTGTGFINGTGTLTSHIGFAVTPNASNTINAALAGNGALTKTGNGLLTLNNGANSYTGGTFIGGGTTDFVAGALGTTGAITFIGNSNLRWIGGNTEDLSSRLSVGTAIGSLFMDNDVVFANTLGGATGGMTKQGTGNLTLNAPQTYTGATTVGAGTLTYGVHNALGNGPVTIGTATLDMGAFNDSVGQVTMSGTGFINGTGTLTSDLGFNVISNTSNTINVALAGTGNLVKTGNGLLTLNNAANSFTGGTNITTSTIDFVQGALGTTGPITFTGNSNLRWIGGNTEDVSSRLSVGTAIGSLFMDNDVTFASTVGGTTGGMTKQGTGTLSLNAGIAYSGLTSVNAGTLVLGGNNSSLPGGVTVNAGTLRVSAANNLPAGTLLFSNNASVLDLRNDASTNFAKAFTVGAFSTTINVDQAVGGSGTNGTHTLGAATLGNSTLNITGANGYNLAVGAATLNSGFGVFNATTANVSVASVSSAPTSNFNLHLRGNTADNTVGDINIGFGGLFRDSGTGTWTLTGNNSATLGGTTVTAGTLRVSTPNNFTAGLVTLGAATLDLRNDTGTNFGKDVAITANNATFNVDRAVGGSGTGGTHTMGNATIGGNNTLHITGANDYRLALGNVTITAVTPIFNPTTANVDIASVSAANFNFTLGGTSTDNTIGAINTGTGAVIKNTASTWTLTGASTYTGTTFVQAGTMNVSGTLGNTPVALSAGTLSLQGAGAVNQNLITITGTGTLGQTATNGLSGTAALTLSAVGATANLSQANDYTGATTITNGILTLSHAQAAQNSTVAVNIANGLRFGTASSAYTIGGLTGTAAFVLEDTVSSPVALSIGNNNTSPAAHTGVIGGSGSLAKVGTGTLILGGANTFNGGLTIKEGTANGINVANAFGAGTIYLGDTIGTANATLSGGGGIASFNNPIVVQSGSSGQAIITTSADVAFGGAVTLNKDLLVAPSDRIVRLTGGMTGNGNLTIATSGTGATNIEAASVNMSGTVTNSGSGTGTTTISSVLGSNVTNVLQNSATSMLILGAMNTYTGSTTIQAGTLKLVGVTSILPTTTDVLMTGSGTTLDLNGVNQTIASLTGVAGSSVTNSSIASSALTISAPSGSTTFSGSINDGSGPVSLTKSGNSTQVLAGNNTYSGTTTITGGTLALADGSSNNNIANSTQITVGTGVLLDVTGLSGSQLNLASGQTLTGGGNVLGNLQVGPGSVVSPGNSPGTLTTLGNEIWNGGSYLWELNEVTLAGGSQASLKGIDPGADWRDITGTLTINTPLTIDIHGLDLGNVAGAVNNWNPFNNYQWIIASAGSGVSGSAGASINTANFTTNNAIGDGAFSLSQDANNVYLNFAAATAGIPLYWDTNGATAGAGNPANGVWSTSVANWNISSAGTGSTMNWIDGMDAAVFSAGTDATGSSTVTISSGVTTGNITVQEGDVHIASGTLTLAGTNPTISVNSPQSLAISSVVTGSDGLTKAGTGTLTLSGANTFTGGLSIDAGTLSVESIGNQASASSNAGGAYSTINIGSTSNTGQLTHTGTGEASDRIINLAGTTGGATLDQSGTGLLLFSSNFTATGAGAKTLTLQGSTAGSGELAGAIVDNGGPNTTAVTKDGTGTWTLSGANSYSGPTTLNAGTLVMSGSNGSAGTVTVTGGTLQLDNASNGGLASGLLTLSTSTVQAVNADRTLSNAVSLIGNPTISGGQSIALNGAVTQSGANRILTNSITGGGNDLTLAGGLFLSENNVNARILTLGGAGTTVISGSIANNNFGNTVASGLTYNGPGGTLTLTAANTYSGVTTITAGTLRLDGNGNLGSSVGVTTIANNAALQLNNLSASVADAITSVTGTGVGGTGAIRNIAGNNTLAGLVTLGGATRINADAGTLTFDVSSGNAIAAANHALTLGGAGNITVADPIATGTGTLTKNGTGTLSLGGANTFTGATIVNTGTLNLDYSASNTSKLADGAALTLGGVTLNLAGGSHVEVVGSTSLAGANQVMQSGGSAVLRMNAISPGSGSVNFSADDIASTSTANNISGILGGWATVGGTDWATNSGVLEGSGNNYIRAFTGYTDVSRLGPGNTIASNPASHVRIVEAGTTGNITPAAAGTTDINTLLNIAAGGPAVYDPGVADVLRLSAAGAIVNANTAGSLTIGASANDGALTAGGAPNTAGTMTLNNQHASNAFTVHSTITDNGTGAVSVVVTGIGATALTGNNTYTGSTTVNGAVSVSGDNSAATGATVVNGGVLTLEATNSIGGATTVNTGGTLSYAANDAIVDGANVTVSGGTFDIGAFSDTVNTVTLNSGTITGTSGTLTSLTDMNLFTGTISAVLSGNVDVYKRQTGPLTLSGMNTFTGQLYIGAAPAADGGSVFVGTLADKGNPSNIGLFSDIHLLSDSGRFARFVYTGGSVNTDRGLSIRHPITGGGGSVDLDVVQSGITLGLTGSGSWGSGSYRLNGPATGLSTLNLGVIDLNAQGGDGGSWTASARLNVHVAAFTSSLGGSTTSASTFHGPTNSVGLINFSNSKALNFNGVGTTTLSGNNIYSGTMQVDNGTIILTGSNAGASGGWNITNDGTLRVGNGGTTGTLSSGTIANAGQLLFDRTDINYVAANTISGAGHIQQVGTGKTTLSGTNTNTGLFTVSNGTLQFRNQDSLYNNTPASWTEANITVESGASLAFNVGGIGQFTASDLDILTAIGTASNGFKYGSYLGLDTTNAGGSFVYNSNIANPNGGANELGLVKLGGNTLELGGANTYTGTTDVRAGRLLVNGTHNGGGLYTVDANGTLGGTGSTTADIMVYGTLAAGSSIESLGTGSLTLDSAFFAGLLDYELDTDLITADMIYGGAGSDLTFNSPLLLLSNLGSGSPLPSGTKFTMFAYDGIWNGGEFFEIGAVGSLLPDDSTFSFAGNTWLINYNDSTPGSNFLGDITVQSNFVTLTANDNVTVVPEPATWALAALGLLGLGIYAWRRRR